METTRSINMQFVTKFGKKKTFAITGAKESDTDTAKNIKALAEFMITKNVIELKDDDSFVGLDKAYIEEKTFTPINMEHL